MAGASSIEIRGPMEDGYDEVLTAEALELVADLQLTFGSRIRELLGRRAERQAAFDNGQLPDFLPETQDVRDGDWTVAAAPDDLADRRVEITGPTDRKMLINALNSGANVFMADFEDANTPTWANMVEGQRNLTEAIERTITFTGPDGRAYELKDEVAVLLVRPRGWHLSEKHLLVDGEPVSGALFDFGLYLFHNAQRLISKGSGPYFYLPKLESYLEARLWNDVFNHAQDALHVPRGSVRATVLVETITAAFEMDEILYELREHSAGLNAGRWDYLFSIIKKFRTMPEFTLPDRNSVTMAAPFMRAYAELLAATCHRRGAHAIGGMAAFIPSRRRPEINEAALAKVREDKDREAGQGFDGTWVAHPDLVTTAKAAFDEKLGDNPNQLETRNDDKLRTPAGKLLDVRSAEGKVTEAGLRSNVNVGIQYISSWLRGNGAAAIFNLMEDAATCEISRSQVWQWVHNGVTLDDGRKVTAELVRQTATEELDKIRQQVGDDFFYGQGRPAESRAIFEQVALSEDFIEFLTLPAYDYLD